MGENDRPDFFRLIPAPVFGLADLRWQSERGDVSTFRMAQKYSRAPPKRSSTSSPSNSAARATSLRRVAQTFRPATQAQRLALCPNQDWPGHKPNKLANTRQNLASVQFIVRAAGCPLMTSNHTTMAPGKICIMFGHGETRKSVARLRCCSPEPGGRINPKRTIFCPSQKRSPVSHFIRQYLPKHQAA